MSDYDAAKATVSLLAKVASSTSHTKWRSDELAKGERTHRYKAIPMDSGRLREYAKSLARVGVVNQRPSLPSVAAFVRDLPDGIKEKDGLLSKPGDQPVVDILAVDGPHLPVERLESEGEATSRLLVDVIDTAQGLGVPIAKVLERKATLEGLSTREHDRWRIYNNHMKQAQPEQFLDYPDLSPDNQERDRVRVRVAVETLVNGLENINTIVQVGL